MEVVSYKHKRIHTVLAVILGLVIFVLGLVITFADVHSAK
jgi:hypothetical protein